jgi:hypothetical protein
MNEEGQFEFKIGTPGHDIRSFCAWNGDLVTCTAQTKTFDVYGVVEIYDMAGHCENKFKAERPALSLVPWGHFLVLRTINSVLIYKDNRFRSESSVDVDSEKDD